MPLPRARAKYGYHLWLFAITPDPPMPRLLAYVGAWTWQKAQSQMSQLIIHWFRSFPCWGRMQCASCQVERACNCHQLITFYKSVKKAWVHQNTSQHCCQGLFWAVRPATKLSHFCKIWLRGVQAWPEHHCCHWIASKVKHSESSPPSKMGTWPPSGIATTRLGTPHRLTKTSLARRIHRSIVWNCFQLDKTFTGLGSFPQGTCIVDGYDLILTASPVAPTTDLKGDWTSTCHQTRRKAQVVLPSLRATTARGASPGEIWREQHSETTFQFTFCTGKSHLWDDIWSRRGANFGSCVHLSPGRFWTCRKHEMQKLWAANIFQSNSKVTTSHVLIDCGAKPEL